MQQVFVVWDDGKSGDNYCAVNDALQTGASLVKVAAAAPPKLPHRGTSRL